MFYKTNSWKKNGELKCGFKQVSANSPLSQLIQYKGGDTVKSNTMKTSKQLAGGEKKLRVWWLSRYLYLSPSLTRLVETRPLSL